jgi:hypothetical protein
MYVGECLTYNYAVVCESGEAEIMGGFLTPLPGPSSTLAGRTTGGSESWQDKSSLCGSATRPGSRGSHGGTAGTRGSGLERGTLDTGRVDAGSSGGIRGQRL